MTIEIFLFALRIPRIGPNGNTSEERLIVA
jgi:hypothetical protein